MASPLKARLVLVVIQVLLESVEILASVARLVNPASMVHLVAQVFRGNPVSLENKARRANEVNLVNKDPVDILERMDHPAKLVKTVDLVNQDSQANKAQRV